MSATLRADDPRAREIQHIHMSVTGLTPGLRTACLVVWFRDGSHWAATADAATVYDAALAVMSEARECGVE